MQLKYIITPPKSVQTTIQLPASKVLAIEPLYLTH